MIHGTGTLTYMYHRKSTKCRDIYRASHGSCGYSLEIWKAPWLSWRNRCDGPGLQTNLTPTPEPFQAWCAVSKYVYIYYMYIIYIYISWLSPLHICLVLCRFLFDRHNNVPKFIQHPTTYFKKNTNKKTPHVILWCVSNISGFDSEYHLPTPFQSFRCQHMKELFDPLPRSWI